MHRTDGQNEEIHLLYETIRRLHEHTHKLIAEVKANHYDTKLWDEIRADDREVGELWRKVYQLEEIWPL
jgi:hypothetical protein